MEIAKIIKKKINYEGEKIWDKNKPTGPKRRFVNINKAKKLIGYQPRISLEKGLEKTIKWYQDNHS